VEHRAKMLVLSSAEDDIVKVHDDLVDAAARRLADAGFPSADHDVLSIRFVATSPMQFAALVERRASGEPLEWIVGSTTFAGQQIKVVPGVYVPRPQTEELARRAAERLPEGGSAADLCAGSGAVAVHLTRSRPAARVFACDLDPVAARCASRNGLAAVLGDLDGPFRSAAFDVVTAVTPYVPRDALGLLPRDVLAFEPRAALDGGHDGLDVVRRLIRGAARLLRPGGWLLTELGGEQDEPAREALLSAGYSEVSFWQDEDGDLRGVEAQRR
jgi:release factor glutamine methyltransferase